MNKKNRYLKKMRDAKNLQTRLDIMLQTPSTKAFQPEIETKLKGKIKIKKRGSLNYSVGQGQQMAKTPKLGKIRVVYSKKSVQKIKKLWSTFKKSERLKIKEFDDNWRQKYYPRFTKLGKKSIRFQNLQKKIETFKTQQNKLIFSSVKISEVKEYQNLSTYKKTQARKYLATVKNYENTVKWRVYARMKAEAENEGNSFNTDEDVDNQEFQKELSTVMSSQNLIMDSILDSISQGRKLGRKRKTR